MKLTLTVFEIMDDDIWEKVCDLKGINYWAVNEGLMDSDDEIVINESEMKKLNIKVILNG